MSLHKSCRTKAHVICTHRKTAKSNLAFSSYSTIASLIYGESNYPWSAVENTQKHQDIGEKETRMTLEKLGIQNEPMDLLFCLLAKIVLGSYQLLKKIGLQTNLFVTI